MTNGHLDSSAALLERAAALIETRAAEALASKDTPIIDGNPPWTDWYLTFEADEVATPVVAWLRHAALAYKMRNPGTQDEHALTFALKVLGE